MTSISEKVRKELERQSRAAPLALPREATETGRVDLPPDLKQIVADRMRGNASEDDVWRALWAKFGFKFKP